MGLLYPTLLAPLVILVASIITVIVSPELPIPLNEAVTIFFGSLILFLASMAFLLVFRFVYLQFKTYHVTFQDNRDEGGDLQVTYNGPINRKRVNLIVDKVRENPFPLSKGVLGQVQGLR